MDNRQRKRIQYSAAYLVIALLVAWFFNDLIFKPMFVRLTEAPYSEFVAQLEAGKITEVHLGLERIEYRVESPDNPDEESWFNVVPVDDPDMIQRMVDAGVEFAADPPAQSIFQGALGLILSFLPMALIWFFLMRRMGQGANSALSFGRSPAKEIAGEKTGVTYQDVGGVDEVQVELKEIIEFLKDPQRFTRLGAKLPKGVLLVGPPGTGKTLLAKATAGEADVPFFSISGSDFVEMFVGVGASRVRDLFTQAKAKAPCIVFIDEIDAIGQSRASAGALGGNDEREQTLNQLLSEMDGFQPNQGVIIMAATNRPEVLDRALLRPGRFDRQVQVVLPTEAGRRQILGIHTRAVTLASDVDVDKLAQITAGFSGADLANIVNEAALLAVRKERDAVTMVDFDLAIERVVAGLQRKMTLKPELKRRVAYHEGGHALVAALQKDTDPVHKVSIIPTAKGALGYTLQMPDEDTYLLSKSELEQNMAVMMGGRAAELLIFNDTSTGASNDLERATEMARRMVTEFGMSESLGPVRYANPVGMGTYLNPMGGLRQDISMDTAKLIDTEIRKLVENAEKRAVSLLQEHINALNEVARVLVAKEVISGDDIRAIIA